MRRIALLVGIVPLSLCAGSASYFLGLHGFHYEQAVVLLLPFLMLLTLWQLMEGSSAWIACIGFGIASALGGFVVFSVVLHHLTEWKIGLCLIMLVAYCFACGFVGLLGYDIWKLQRHNREEKKKS